MSSWPKVLMHLILVAVLAAAMSAAATGAVHQDPRVCSFTKKECAFDAATSQLKRSLHTDGAIACVQKASSLLRFRCSWRNSWQTGLATVVWAPVTFKPTVTVLSLVCQSVTVTGAALPQTGCTKTIPYQPSS